MTVSDTEVRRTPETLLIRDVGATKFLIDW